MSIVKIYPFSKDTEFAPEPEPASKVVPDWYRKQPSYMNEEQALKGGFSASTVKRCMPVFDSMTAGYILKMPCDVYIDATNPEKLEVSLPQSIKFMTKDIISTHTPQQVTHYPVDTDKYHSKIFRVLPLYSFGTEKGYSCLFIHPMHADNVPFKAIPGLIDTDGYISEGHLSFHIEKNFKGIITKGTPIVQVIPFKRDSYQMQIVSYEESAKTLQKQRMWVRTFFKNAYRNYLRSPKDYK
jgi:hypothetical protein